MNIHGRTSEINELIRILDSQKAEFLAVYGRRRVGKTYLIKEFFSKKDVVFFNITGMQNGKLAEQIDNFFTQLGDIFFSGASLQREKTWRKTFHILTQAISKLPKDKKVVLFFDELPWLASHNSRLLQSIDYYWNQYWSVDPRIKFIISGSSASWIIKNIINNKGGLHNRLTSRMALEPFSLHETKTYLKKQKINLNEKQVLRLYMAFGGIPYYLSHMRPGLSAMQIIEELAFSNNGILVDEFEKLFRSLFTNHEFHLRVIEELAQHRYGIGKRQLLLKLNAVGGSSDKKLDELEDAGFIISFTPMGHTQRGRYYRLIDEYCYFYLKWIKPIKTSLKSKTLEKGSWQLMENTPEWNNWQGYAFEAVCYKHLREIRRALGLLPNAIPHTWRYSPTRKSQEKGAQIDLLFDRYDGAINICEIKCTDKPFTITKAYLENLQQKLTVFQNRTKTDKQLLLSMICSGGLTMNDYANDNIHGVVKLNDLFAKNEN